MENALINYDDNKIIETLTNTVALGATKEEFAIFVQLCKATGLNPFKKEVWFIKAGGRAQIMTGLNGYLAIANRHPQFDGMEIDIAVDESGSPVKATAKVYRKDRKFPSTGIALWKEWQKPTPIWKEKPSVMLAKVAKSIAIREAFALELAGTYTEEEMPADFAATKVIPAETSERAKLQWIYDLTGVAQENIESAVRYCQDNGAIWNGDRGVYVSETRLTRLDKYQVQQKEAA